MINKEVFNHRLKSFLWRLGGIILAYVLAFASENIGLFDLPIWTITIIGLIIGEITKYLNVDLVKLRNNE